MTSSLTLIFSFFTVITAVSAVEILVGGDVGWRIPAAHQRELYNVWASRRRIHMGDSLRFRYKNDSVAVVDKSEFYNCNSSKPMRFFNDGDTVFPLYSSGYKYFISGYSDRCRGGMKMMVNVLLPSFLSNRQPPSPPSLVHSSSNSMTSFSVSVTAFVVGLGLWELKL